MDGTSKDLRVSFRRPDFAYPLSPNDEEYERLLYKIRTSRVKSSNNSTTNENSSDCDIEIDCPNCHKSIAFNPKDSGARGKCPYCDSHFTIPSCCSSSQQQADWTLSHQNSTADNLIDVFCPQCHKLLTFRSKDFGKKCWCSGCHHGFTVPETDPIARYCAQIKFSQRKPSSDNFVKQIQHEQNSSALSQNKSCQDDSDSRSYHWYAALLFIPFALLISYYSFRVVREFMLHFDYVVTDAQIVSWTEHDYIKRKQHTSMFNNKSYDAKMTDVRKDYVFDVGGVMYDGHSFDTIEDCSRWSKGGNRQRIPEGYYSATKVRYDPNNPHRNTLKSFSAEFGFCLLVICLSILGFICAIHHAWFAIFKREFFKARFIRTLLRFLP